MPTEPSRFRRMLRGELDCPLCGVWESNQRLERGNSRGDTYWNCAGCGSLLVPTSLYVGLRGWFAVFAMLAVIVTVALAIEIDIDSAGSDSNRWLMSLAVLGAVAWIFYIPFFVLPAFILSLTKRSCGKEMFQAGVCRQCGYDLRGANHARCPECGESCAGVMRALGRQAYRPVDDAASPLVKPIQANEKGIAEND